jgi:hypothetical protein
MVIVKNPPLPAPEFCSHFSFMELSFYPFSKWIVQSIFVDKPSVCPSGALQQTLGEVCSTANAFQPLYPSPRRKVIMHRHLIAFVARGAAALGTNCLPGFDAVLPYLSDSTDLDKNNADFMIVQVTNDSKFSGPNDELFQNMDPFQCGLLEESGVDGCFSIPIIRIVFVLWESVHGHAHEVPVTIGWCQSIELRPGWTTPLHIIRLPVLWNRS